MSAGKRSCPDIICSLLSALFRVSPLAKPTPKMHRVFWVQRERTPHAASPLAFPAAHTQGHMGWGEAAQAELEADPQYQRLLKAFRLFDKNGDGNIDAGELRELLLRANPDADPTKGDPLTEADCQTIINSFDDNGDGVLSIEELVAAWSTIGGSNTQLCACALMTALHTISPTFSADLVPVVPQERRDERAACGQGGGHQEAAGEIGGANACERRRVPVQVW